MNIYKKLCFILIICLSNYSIANSDEIAKAEKVIVKIGNGTGFTIDNNYIFTAQHVIEGKNIFDVTFRNGNVKQAKVIDSSELFDLAILSISTNIDVDYYFPKNDVLKKGNKFFTIGFPSMGADWQHDELSYSGENKEQLIFSSNINGGNSGGPIIKDKKIVGIIVKASSGHAYATPISSIRKFLKGIIPDGKIILQNNDKRIDKYIIPKEKCNCPLILLKKENSDRKLTLQEEKCVCELKD